MKPIFRMIIVVCLMLFATGCGADKNDSAKTGSNTDAISAQTTLSESATTTKITTTTTTKNTRSTTTAATTTTTTTTTTATTTTTTAKTTTTTTAATTVPTTTSATAAPVVTTTTTKKVTTSTTTAPPPVVTTTTTTTLSFDQYASEVVKLVNQQRSAAGVAPLAEVAVLSEMATTRANEISTLFSHTRPNGAGLDSVFADYNVKWWAIGENIAAGQKTPAEVMNAWMNSAGHKANILSADFSSIGVGVVKVGSTIYWVQIFATIQ